MAFVPRRVGELSVGYHDLSDAPRRHSRECVLDRGDHGARSHHRPQVILVLVKRTALRAALGLERPPEVSDGVPAPVEDSAIPPFGRIALPDRHVLVAVADRTVGEVAVGLDELRARFLRGRGGRGEEEREGSGRGRCRGAEGGAPGDLGGERVGSAGKQKYGCGENRCGGVFRHGVRDKENWRISAGRDGGSRTTLFSATN
mmetsp:Transcript_45472/g.88830  ORF Transcript_45472/g.88830 Transcript_45472/m.88830 type:complete len:202 (+) Transcript_45472:296-901(+)